MNIFDSFVLWFADTSFYEKYVSQWPAPLNNVSFDATILIILLIIAVKAVIDAIQSYFFHQRLKAKQRRNRELELDRAIKEKEKSDENELLSQYMKFMMIAQMQNMTSVQGLSFDAWKQMKTEAENKGLVKEAAKDTEPEPKKEAVEPIVPKPEPIAASEPVIEEPEPVKEDIPFYDIQEETSEPEEVELVEAKSEVEDIPEEKGFYDLTPTVPELTESVIEEPKKEDTEEQFYDIQGLLSEKIKDLEEKPVSSVENDFVSIINSVDYQKAQSESLQELEQEENKRKAANMALLEKQINGSFVVEGIPVSVDKSAMSDEASEDFMNRRRDILAKEEKEAEKQRRIDEKNAKKEAKQLAREAKRRR